ncbi:PREDICTED: succinate dehydrogenase assembly factor 1, mitochondrial [Mandrillus leucophaeus]|uniref:succinate dehydrogenase assembly factor 1, mitochondrial n=1 Tax=Mandrillus leucophaeus TaxID=9568 RepID=UPI0005F37811|nr:PREDICTED: succinate dehydrogenase assembly factor 1, mitochondrial [Mandrillus leucophaeus]
MSRHSRLQRQVLSLYRDLLRAGRGKPGAEGNGPPAGCRPKCVSRSCTLGGGVWGCHRAVPQAPVLVVPEDAVSLRASLALRGRLQAARGDNNGIAAYDLKLLGGQRAASLVHCSGRPGLPALTVPRRSLSNRPRAISLRGLVPLRVPRAGTPDTDLPRTRERTELPEMVSINVYKSSGHATAMGAFVRPRAPTEEPGGVGSQPDDGDGPRSPHDSTGAPETRPDGR